MANRIVWTAENDKLLMRHYREGTCMQLPDIMGVTMVAIHNRVRKLKDYGYIKVEKRRQAKAEKTIHKKDRVMKSRVVDLTGKVAVKIDNRTWVMRDKSKVV
jgi:predicted transcriptional regulator